MNKMIKFKLEALREFQANHPTAHVGGSIGLMLRGIDLHRSLAQSDLDITVDEFVLSDDGKLDQRSDANDFDYALSFPHSKGYYTKIDLRITPEPSYDVIEFDGHQYNVSKLRDILFWKKKYAEKGVKKHKDDLITIETGVRPSAQLQEVMGDEDDRLPF